MNGQEDDLMKEMELLRSELGSDFCSLALVEPDSDELAWKLASGNENDRCLSMRERAGRGFTGTVVKVGRAMPVNVAQLVMTRQLYEYPILAAEKLRSAYAVPLLSGRSVTGVLLIGDRRKRVYRPEERNRASAAGERIAGLLTEERRQA